MRRSADWLLVRLSIWASRRFGGAGLLRARQASISNCLHSSLRQGRGRAFDAVGVLVQTGSGKGYRTYMR